MNRKRADVVTDLLVFCSYIEWRALVFQIISRVPESRGVVRMINDSDGYTYDINGPDLKLSPPRFDDEASANAQPVRPIPVSRVSAFRNRVASFRQAVVAKFGAFTLVVMGGLLTGTVGGMAWVKVAQVTNKPPFTSESISEVAPSSNLFTEPVAEVAGVQEMPKLPENRIRKEASRFRSSRAPRAYLVDVLRR